ncbi:hypothetical protein Pmani_020674 [Petrolisthes manimaculis]|uniref:Protein FAM114A2 n=1 Tax=Petrolisthes manimaculis TaxID=1843537 RepID=A0AAE1PH40_9EUCA|nr:hypothetical protein Pmani_020674 [Petrolisthes manimaculis]
MSSESDDDFLSADEGSDDDECTELPPPPPPPTLVHQQQQQQPPPEERTLGRAGHQVTERLDTQAKITKSENESSDDDDDDGDDDGGNDDDIDDTGDDDDGVVHSTATRVLDDDDLDPEVLSPTPDDEESNLEALEVTTGIVDEVKDVESREESPGVFKEDATASDTSDQQEIIESQKGEDKSEHQVENKKKYDGESETNKVATEDCTNTLQKLHISDKIESRDCSQSEELNESASIKEETRRKNLNTDNDIKEMESKSKQDKREVEIESIEAASDSIPDRPKPERHATSSATEGNDTSADPTAKKPRESKIGRKKPREKLGERLGGARKLGARMLNKKLEGISSDDIVSSGVSERESCLRQNTDTKLQNQDGGWDREESTKADDKRQQEEELRWLQAQALSRPQETRTDDSGGWGNAWGGWGSSLLSAASTFTREVGRGVGTVMETVESGLGVPDPETMARELAQQEKKQLSESQAPSSGGSEECSSSQDKHDDGNDTSLQEPALKDSGSDGGGMWFGSIVSGVSGALESASNKVLMGGLDTLEVIGRKAMDVIQEGDPGLRKKRAVLTNIKPNLSQVLQDARLRAEEERDGNVGVDRQQREKQKVMFETAWDRTEGVVHLEALTLVARQCENKMSSLINTLPHFVLDMIQTNNAKIKSTCAMEEEESLEGDLAQHIAAVITATTLPLSTTKICQAWSQVQEVWQKEGVDEEELYTTLAEMVSQLVALIHKAAELALITPQADPLKLAAQFKELSSGVCGSLEGTADQVCGSITTKETNDTDSHINNTITNIYLQVSHGNSYVQQSMGCLSTVLQHANVKRVAAQL